LSEIRDTDPSFATRLFGGERMWNVPERGFLETEVGPLGMFRHTDGLAWIDVPSRALHDARMLKIDVLGDGKAGERHRLDVLINDTAIWEGSVGSDVTTLRIPMPSVRPDGVARIELLSDRIDPAKASGEGPRQDLGISLMGIRPLQAGEPVANRPGIAGFRSALAFVGLPPGSRRVAFGSATDFVLDIRNVGNQYWPTAKELGGPAGAVQIALRWYRRDVTNVPVGDNRWPLSISLLPGDRTRVRVPLVPLDLDGKRLPSGEYEVHVEMVRETVAFFSDNGDAVLSIPVLIAP
jgi:hypothetical protein